MILQAVTNYELCHYTLKSWVCITVSPPSSSRWRYWCTRLTTVCALCTSAKYSHQSVALPRTGNYVLPAAAITSDQELELSSVTELFQSLDQSSGTPSLSPSGQPTTFACSNVYWKHTFLPSQLMLLTRHPAAILTVLYDTVLPSRSGSRTLGTKYISIRLDLITNDLWKFIAAQNLSMLNTGWQTDRQPDRQTGWQTNRQTDELTCADICMTVKPHNYSVSQKSSPPPKTFCGIFSPGESV